MTKETWTAVDQYISELLHGPDAALTAALADSTAAGLPEIAVSPAQGQLLWLLAKATGARHVLEIGTLGGYSTIWLARALPEGGRVITMELDPKHAEVARANIARADLDGVVDIRVGPATATLSQLRGEGAGPFDFIFLDADKAGYVDYLNGSLALARPGTLIVADNVVRDGKVADPDTADFNAQAVREFNAALAADPRVTATIVQTVGSKGYDGFAIALVK